MKPEVAECVHDFIASLDALERQYDCQLGIRYPDDGDYEIVVFHAGTITPYLNAEGEPDVHPLDPTIL
jgi:hypothetical protein